MIIDSSAVIAILTGQSGYQRIRRCLAASVDTKIGSPTVVETGMVLVGRHGARGHTMLARLLQENRVAAVPFTEAHSRIALDAFERYGKGRHKAALNFGDCMTYATAYVAGEPLLCVCDDFTHTDLELA